MTGIRLLYSSRHILAIVSGLGFGVMAALYLLLNVIADSFHDGVVGLPAAVHHGGEGGPQLTADEINFPLFYSISCSLLVLLHICWAISL